jgi:hypothetical protein
MSSEALKKNERKMCLHSKKKKYEKKRKQMSNG